MASVAISYAASSDGSATRAASDQHPGPASASTRIGHPAGAAAPRVTAPDPDAVSAATPRAAVHTMSMDAPIQGGLTAHQEQALSAKLIAEHRSAATVPRSDYWTAAMGRSAVARAQSWIGMPYSWAGGDATGPTTGRCEPHTGGDLDCHVVGFDCSGLTTYAWGSYAALPHLAAGQLGAGGFHPTLEQLRPGDLVFFAAYLPGGTGHVGVYAGHGMVIEAPQSGSVVRETSLATMMSEDGAYRGAVRPLTGTTPTLVATSYAVPTTGGAVTLYGANLSQVTEVHLGADALTQFTQQSDTSRRRAGTTAPVRHRPPRGVDLVARPVDAGGPDLHAASTGRTHRSAAGDFSHVSSVDALEHRPDGDAHRPSCLAEHTGDVGPGTTDIQHDANDTDRITIDTVRHDNVLRHNSESSRRYVHLVPPMHENEIAISDDTVRRLIAEQFPSWAGLALARLPPTGTDNQLFRLGRDLLVRMPRIDRASASPQWEHRWLPRLAAKLTMPIPAPVALGRPGEGYPWHWTVVPWFEGHTPTPDTLDPEEWAVGLACFVRQLRDVPRMDAPVVSAGRGAALATLDDWVRTWTSRADASEVDPRAVLAVWQDALDAPAWDGQPLWFHGDLHEGNLLVRDGRLSAVIDWGEAGCGDPAVELNAMWGYLPASVATLYRDTVDLDEAAYRRGRGFALAPAISGWTYYRHSAPHLSALALATVQALVASL